MTQKTPEIVLNNREQAAVDLIVTDVSRYLRGEVDEIKPVKASLGSGKPDFNLRQVAQVLHKEHNIQVVNARLIPDETRPEAIVFQLEPYNNPRGRKTFNLEDLTGTEFTDAFNSLFRSGR